MKQFMLRSLMLLSLLCSTWGVGGVWAQFRDGGVYYFESAYSETLGKSITLVDNQTYLNLVTTNTEDTKQLWEADEVSTGVFTLKNLSNNKYLWSSNNSAPSNPVAYWKTVDEVNDYCKFSCTQDNGTYAMRATNTTDVNHYMHYSQGTTHIQCWAATAAASRWYIHEVVVYDEAAVPGALSNLFSDAACTTLKKEFADEAALTADIDYLKLPEALRNMVKKVYSQTWTENNYDGTKSAWDSDYAQKYRVQLYEPYNDIMKASSALGLNWHTNMNNPTGIFANNGDVLYVMVDGEIEEGASLYLDYFVDGERLSTDLNHGTSLQPGLNIITCTADKSNYCINYVVETFDVSNNKRGHAAKNHRLSDYKPIKIHIEGGYINGYWNKMGDALYGEGDKNADWEYLEARANQKEVLILGQYMTLQFPLKDKDTEGNTGLATYLNDSVKVEDVIREWDNIMMWERLLLGVLGEEALNAASPESPYSESDHVIEYTGNDSDFYGDYYNIHGLAWGVNHNFMYATGDMSAYHYNTMRGIFQEMPTSAGSHWGPAHEIGHQHQNLIKMRGEMEVSNNLFSNVVLWMYGETTSRVNGTEGSLENILKNFYNESGHYLTNSVWGATQMYYKLFLYYHVLGHNPQFYPRLFEILRLDPQKDNNASAVNGANAQLHLYKKVCEAAGEDLTEFFRAHGFFKPLDGWTIDDYGVSTYYMTQAQIDAAIAEVKAQAKSNDWKENTAVLFINDATGESILSHREDVEYLELYGETTICAEVGGYSNFNNKATNYTYTISGNTVKMEGEGGVGFAVFNEKGEIVAFSNNKTFEISAEAAAVIASGKGSIVTINGNSTTTPTTNAMESADAETQHKLLGQLLADVQTLIELEDATGKKVGFYKPASVADLKTLYDEAKAVYDAQNEASYTAAYSALYQEYVNLQNNDFARNGIVQGNSYRLINKNYPTRKMTVTPEDDVMWGLIEDDSDNNLWYFETAPGQDKYYLKNKATEKYPGDVSTGSELKADQTISGAYAYQLREMGSGVFALVGATGLHCSTSNQDFRIVGWGVDAEATQWYITAVDQNEVGTKRLELETVIAQTEELVNEMANVMMKGTLDLSTCTITSNATETGHETKYLIDRNTSTFFHTVWSGTAVQAHHNIIVDLGEGNSLEQFVLNYTTLPSSAHNVDAPTAIVIKGSSDGDSYEDITTINSGLPVEKDATYISDVLGTVGTGYRYIRFDVTDATGGKLGDYKYFGIAELGLTNMQTKVLSVNPSYSASEPLIVEVCEVLDAGISVCSNKSATADELQEATANLTEKYNELLQAYNDVKNAPLIARKKELQTLIERTQTLIAKCGEVNRIPEAAESISLSADAGTYPYLSCPNLYNPNNLTTNGGDNDYNCAHLLDGDIQTYIHTDHTANAANAATYPHYLQVDFGTTAAPDYFKFTYDTRYENGNQAPKKIVVKGSNNGGDFEELGTYSSADATNALPTNAQTRWKVDAPITSGYRYVRFYVTESAKGTTTPYFVMAEFGVSKITPSFYSAVLKNNVGEVTEELLLNTHLENLSAQATLEFANTEAQVVKAIAQLQAQKDALEAAKNVVDKSGLIQLIGTATEILKGCGTVTPTPNGEVLNVTLNEQAGSVNKDMLRDLYRAIETAKGVRDNANATQEEVNAEIAELTAQIAVVQTAKKSPAKAELETAIDVAKAAINSCASSITQDGDEYTVVWKFETAGDVDKATLIAAYEALHSATDVYNGDASTVSAYENALESLKAPLATLHDYQGGFYKSQLRFYVAQVTTLIANCEETRGDLTDDMYNDIVDRHATADAYLTQEFETHDDLEKAIKPEIEYFEGNIVTWQTAQQSTAKSELRAEITKLTDLINQCGEVTSVPNAEGNEAHYVATLDPYAGVVTEEQLIAAYVANLEAEALANNSAVAAELTAKKEVLQGIYNSLLTAKNTNWLPVSLTTDINNPVLYTFKSKRGDSKALQYDPADAHSFCITDAIDGAAKQAFFFMMGDTRNQVYIYPYAGAGMVLGANNTGNGANKVFAGEKGSQTNEQWIFTERTVNGDTWYDLKPVGKNTYFSNFGGGSNNMGFYGSADDGSGFQFVETSVEGSAAYNSLKLYYDEAVKVKNTPLIGGDGVGYYPEGQAKVYNTAYTEATEKLSTTEATSEEYLNAYCALRSANEALVMNMPADGYYIIQSVVKDNGTALAYANFTDNKMYWGRGKTAVNAEAIWKFSDNGDGTYTVSNMHTGTLINGFIYNKPSPLHPATTGTVTLQSLAPDGQIGIYSNGTMMHAQSGGEIVRWNTGANDASAWRVIEVDLEAVGYPLTITQFGYAGLHLNYPVEIPEGVTAYTIYEAEGANGVARMQPIDGGIIPANTGVIIKGNQGDYTFDYAEYNGGELNNLLSGSNYTRYVKAEANTDYFVFAAKKQSDNSYKVGLYITWEECDANGSTDVKDAEGNVTGSNKGTHNGGYFKSSANKIFLACDEHEVAGVQKFFFSTDEALTDIDAFLNGCSETTEIYDLQGRRVTKVTKNGVYIVNGEKQFIKVTKL